MSSAIAWQLDKYNIIIVKYTTVILARFKVILVFLNSKFNVICRTI